MESIRQDIRYAFRSLRRRDRVRQSFGEERFRTILIDLFGVIALLLAGRTREVSIRVALGAPAASVVRMIVVTTLGGVTIGVVLGFVVSLGASQVAAPYLYGVSPYDGVTYVAIFGIPAAVSLVASWVPARRAGRVDPASALRLSS